MIPVYQEKGECVRACIASILEVPQWQVMRHNDFAPDNDNDEIWEQWLRFAVGAFGYEPNIIYTSKKNPVEPPKGYSIGLGIEKGMQQHAVVLLDGQLAHDPHPGGEGLIRYTKFITLEHKTTANE